MIRIITASVNWKGQMAFLLSFLVTFGLIIKTVFASLAQLMFK